MSLIGPAGPGPLLPPEMSKTKPIRKHIQTAIDAIKRFVTDCKRPLRTKILNLIGRIKRKLNETSSKAKSAANKVLDPKAYMLRQRTDMEIMTGVEDLLSKACNIKNGSRDRMLDFERNGTEKKSDIVDALRQVLNFEKTKVSKMREGLPLTLREEATVKDKEGGWTRPFLINQDFGYLIGRVLMSNKEEFTIEDLKGLLGQ